MKSIKRNIVAIFFVIVLTTSAVFADGEMGGGGFTANEDPVKASQSATADDGEMGGGGRGDESETGFIECILTSIDAYLDSIL